MSVGDGLAIIALVALWLIFVLFTFGAWVVGVYTILSWVLA